MVSSIFDDWQVSGVYRWTSGRPRNVAFNIPGIGAANLTGSADGNPNARIVLTCDPGSGYSDDPYAQFNTSCFAPPQPGSDGAESARFFMRDPPINNLDLSLSKAFAGPKNLRFEIRIDAFNALNHTQFTGFNNTADFASLTNRTITNLPLRLGREPGATRRLRVRQRRGGAARAAGGHARDLLARGSTNHCPSGPAPAARAPAPLFCRRPSVISRLM